MSEDAIHRAARWQAFYEEDGGLREVLAMLRQAYFDRAADLMPNDTAALLKLGMAAKIVEQIDAHSGAKTLAVGMRRIDNDALDAGEAARLLAPHVPKLPAQDQRDWFADIGRLLLPHGCNRLGAIGVEVRDEMFGERIVQARARSARSAGSGW
jgi:hypothetical protein